MTYTYDGDGKRVKKSNGKLYWYGTGSDLLDESDAAGSITDEYIFFNGKRIARRHIVSGQPAAISYYFADHLGTARVVTDASGTILDDSDFYLFGGARPYLSSSGNNYKFTGKERDAESILDNFGVRYCSPIVGRFISSDPLQITAQRLVNPQRFNLYMYGINNPLRFSDWAGFELVKVVVEGQFLHRR